MLGLLKLQSVLWIFGLFVYFHGSTEGHPLSKKSSANGKRKSREANTEYHTMEGSVAKIKCDPKGFNTNTVNVTWFHNEREITDKSRFRITPKSLDIKQVTASDAGVFSCRLTTTKGMMWTNSTLILTAEGSGRLPTVPQMLCNSRMQRIIKPESRPKFTFYEGVPDIHDASIVKLIKEPLNLPCCASGHPAPRASWSINGVPLDVAHTGLETFKQLDDGSLSFLHLTPTDSGNYTCKAENLHGEVTFKYEVKVEPRPDSQPPSIESDYPGNIDAVIGGKAEFRCKTKSSTNFQVEWGRNRVQENDSTVENDERLFDHQILKEALDARYTFGAASFSIDNVTHLDGGKYYCIASNGYGEDMKTGQLIVHEKPAVPIPREDEPNRAVFISVGAIVSFLALILFGFLCRYKQKKDREFAKKLQRPEEIPVHHISMISPRRRIKISRRSSDRSEDSLLQRYCYEATIMPMDTESIVTSRATTISHCNSTIEYVCDFPVDEKWEFPRDQLSFGGDGYGQELGKGAFGKVVKAKAINIREQQAIIDVAVKMPKEPQSEDDEVSTITGLCEELEIMKNMDHPNIIRLLGCCSQLSEGPLFVIMEYAPFGNLKDFLRDYKKRRIENLDYEQPLGLLELTNRNLVSFAAQIASGALYLADKKFVHRDLAARNILVTENHVMKLADFGLSKDLWNQDYYRKTTKGLLPIKWMAPESFDENKYTTQSDVWSFGVLLWEIWSFGDTPYGDKIPLERMIVNIKAGTRLGKPEGCSPEIYRMMDNCWKIEPNDRPSFQILLNSLKRILEEEYLEVASPEPTPFHVENPNYMYRHGSSKGIV